MKSNFDLLDRIDTIKANSVTAEEFEKIWGKSLKDHLDEMMDFWCKIEARAKEVIEVVNQPAEKRHQPVAEPQGKTAVKAETKQKRRIDMSRVNADWV